MSMPRMVLTQGSSEVHDLATKGTCRIVAMLRRELSQGQERYIRVKGIQVQVYKLPGCRACFGSVTTFKSYIQSL